MSEEMRLANIERLVEKIFNVLDGPKGLVTKVELHEQIISNIPSPLSLKVYAFAGGGLFLFVGLLGFAIIKGFS